MGKLVLVIILITLIGFIYSPYEVTSRYAEAVEKRDVGTYVKLTDVVSYRESFKENMRPVFAEWARSRVPASQSSAKNQSDVIVSTLAYEKQTDLLFTEANAEKMIDATRKGSDEYKFVKKGWRSPFVFVAVDNMDDTKMIFEFQGINGWRLAKLEASKDMMRRELRRELSLLGH